MHRLLVGLLATAQTFGVMCLEAVDVARMFQESIADTAEILIHAETFLIY